MNNNPQNLPDYGKEIYPGIKIGDQFHRFTIIGVGEDHISSNGRRRKTAKCMCSCENHTIMDVRIDSLKSGHAKSCGCFKNEKSAERLRVLGTESATHGKSTERLYRVYKNMVFRCYSPKFNEYHLYGARGIRVCPEWFNGDLSQVDINGFRNFWNWAMMNGYREDLTIDRINVNGNYEPSNCRWATVKEQSNNTSTNRIIDYFGNDYTMSQCYDIMFDNAYQYNPKTFTDYMMYHNYNTQMLFNFMKNSGRMVNGIWFENQYGNPIPQMQYDDTPKMRYALYEMDDKGFVKGPMY